MSNKYISGRVKKTPQDRLKGDRYKYLGLGEAEPNLGDPLHHPENNNPPTGQKYQLISVDGDPGRRYWIPTGGGFQEGSISIYDESVLVGVAKSITELDFKGASVTAFVDVQNPSGHPGIAATITVIPTTISDNAPAGDSRAIATGD